MRREFIPFDEHIIRKDFLALPDRDQAKMLALIEHYQQCGSGNPSPAQIDDYGGGLLRLRHVKQVYQGRLIFVATDRMAEFERLNILVVFKKQSQDVPQKVLETARYRKKQWEESRKNK